MDVNSQFCSKLVAKIDTVSDGLSPSPTHIQDLGSHAAIAANATQDKAHMHFLQHTSSARSSLAWHSRESLQDCTIEKRPIGDIV